MMTAIDTQIIIEASANKVWSILTDFSAMPAWNPFIRSISGPLVPGGRLSVQIAPPGRAAMTFEPTVLVVEPGRELRWAGVVLGRWIFAGEHFFVLDQIGPDATRLVHGERFSGLLGPLIMRGPALDATKRGFAAMNDQLKRRAE